MILTILDAIGIQDYVFGSNKLKDNIGGSALVECALSRWPIDVARACFPGFVSPAFGYIPDPENSVLAGTSQSEIRAELFYAGGGNTVLYFDIIDRAKEFAREYSRKLLSMAPGLKIACIHAPVKNGNVAYTLQQALLDLAQKKMAYEPGIPLLGMGVTLPCAYTKKPANGFDPDKKDVPLSYEVLAKRSQAIQDISNRRFVDLFGETLSVIDDPEGHRADLLYPKEFDDLGPTRGDTSYIGVVHMDGNGMGQKVAQLTSGFAGKSPPENEQYVKEMRSLSKEIEDRGKGAVRNALDIIRSSMKWSADDETFTVVDKVKLSKSKKDGPCIFPLRLLVYGGDDITFVCDGRIALDLAAFMLKSFQDEGKGYFACAGVAIVKSHYPFARAYEMAESLCKSAKTYIRDKMKTPKASAIDWHVTAGGVEADIRRIRKREYGLSGGVSLTLRPYVLDGSGEPLPPGHSWNLLRHSIMDEFVKPGSPWLEHKTKLREFAIILRSGEDHSARELERWKVKTKNMPSLPDDRQSENQVWSETGFCHDATPYIDALELIDMLPYSGCWGMKKGGACE
jgi:hypothetical protein